MHARARAPQPSRPQTEPASSGRGGGCPTTPVGILGSLGSLGPPDAGVRFAVASAGVKPAPFEYHSPATVAEALALLREHGDDAKPLAGGQSLVPMLALRLTRFAHLVDLNGVGALAGVELQPERLHIGSTTRQRVLERDATVAAAVPLLARAAPHIGHFQIRNRGTVGGSLAHADPASELPAVAVALDAELVVGERTVAARDFFTGTWTTTLADDELLTAAVFPVWSGDVRAAVHEVARRNGDFALAGAAIQVSVDDGRVARAAIALFGLDSTPVRALDAEAALVAGESLAAVAALAVRDVEPNDDIHATGAQRRRIGAAVVERALQEVCGG